MTTSRDYLRSIIGSAQALIDSEHDDGVLEDALSDLLTCHVDELDARLGGVLPYIEED